MWNFNTYFTNVTAGLNLRVVQKDQSFEKEESHKLIKYHYENEAFSLQPISKQDIFKAAKKLSSNRACISNENPVNFFWKLDKLLLRKTFYKC